ATERVHALAALEQLGPSLWALGRIEPGAREQGPIVEECARAAEPRQPVDAPVFGRHVPQMQRVAKHGRRIGPVDECALVREGRKPGRSQLDQIGHLAARHGGGDLLLPCLPRELLDLDVEIWILGAEARDERLDRLRGPELPEHDDVLLGLRAAARDQRGDEDAGDPSLHRPTPSSAARTKPPATRNFFSAWARVTPAFTMTIAVFTLPPACSSASHASS